MSGPRAPSRQSSYGSINTLDARNAALLGATKAFGRPAVNTRTPSTTYTGTNGALAAATRAGPAGRPMGSSNGASNTSGMAGNVMMRPSHTGPTQRPVPGKRGTENVRDIAQYQAVSPTKSIPRGVAGPPSEGKAVPESARPRAFTTNRPSVAPKPRRLSGSYNGDARPRASRDTDSSPTRPTSSLVQLYERKSTEAGASVRTPRAQSKADFDLPLASPKPVRVPASSGGGITSMFQMELGESKDARKLNVDDRSSGEDYFSASEDTATPATPVSVRKRQARALDGPADEMRAIRTPSGNRTSPSPLRHASTQPIQIRPAPAPARVGTLLPEQMSGSSQSGKSIAAQYRMLHPRRMTPLSTGDDLANAMVASSLASSRAASPSKLEVPMSSSRHHHHKLSLSRTPSPAKQRTMLHTLRKVESEESETEDEAHPYGKHRKKRRVRKHPNKHHEGDRKRWRDAVTERERKRYEGVWAANKGLHISFTPDEERELKRTPGSPAATPSLTVALECVSHIVVRDIWSRSRLNDDVLEAVWELVDNDQIGRLNKEEFVVGMWLIDQRLKGRKLPVKVTESIWASVRGLQGIKIRKMH
ncbi:Increased rDNA silencing protein [Recurvomyces mirabilis]|uniref:Increased rDNA silencing protein n=1 Tax=Recurvomyces mirabilis TaxID=574656 RepID=A0AAE0WXF0_9PEZI|nr:Increased rDNA silencing protein [Recurvomyces mirabilis]KAK5162176.1 Increased rDNA silencing protein [Recurvomyces mirabilis]